MTDDLKDFHYSRDFFEMRTPLVCTWFIAIVVFIMLGMFAWAWFGEIDVVVKASAILRPLQNVSTLKNAVTGPVIAKYYSQGKLVKKGDILWKVDSSAYSIDLRNNLLQKSRIDSKLSVMRSFASSVIAGENTIIPSDEEAWAKASVYFSEKNRLELNYKKAFDIWQSEKSLPDSMISSQKVKNLEIELELAKIAYASFISQERLKLQEESLSLDEELANLEKRITDLKRLIADSEIRSPLSGTLEEIKKYNIGDYLMAGEEVLRIIPEGSDKFLVELNVDNKDIAEIQSGMKVYLRFQALPSSDFGQLDAEILRIPADAIRSANTSSYFVIEAELDKSFLVNRKGKKVNLKSGMMGDGRIIIKRKNILNLILESLDFIS